MRDMITAREAAAAWGVSERQVTEYCRTDRVPGAKKNGRRWMIPIYACKPEEDEYFSDSYIDYCNGPLPMVQGSDLFTEAVNGRYFVDKTLFIKEVLKDPSQVILITRPRRFGKSLNLDMLKVFFEKTAKDRENSIYFTERKIWKENKIVNEHMGRYPVVHISFKDADKSCIDDVFYEIASGIAEEYGRHPELEESDALSERYRKFYRKAVDMELSRNELRDSLYFLTYMLSRHWKSKVMVLIDEYDMPVNQGYSCGFYDEIVEFMRGFLSKALKTTPYLFKGVLTGILRISKESIFSGLNNAVAYSILDDRYGEYFGFTEEEIMEAAAYYSCPQLMDAIEEWYDGYRFGRRCIYNPWSVARFFNNGMKPGVYWENTGRNAILRELLEMADNETENSLARLMEGEKLSARINTAVSYPLLGHDRDSIYSMLAVSGYLRVEEAGRSMEGFPYWEVSIPNKEIAEIWNVEIRDMLQKWYTPSVLGNLQLSVMTGDADAMERQITEYLHESASFFDTSRENFFHGFMLGLATIFGGYSIRSNRESGLGRYDLMLIPDKQAWPGIVIELKALENADHEKLKASAAIALGQIKDKEYDTELKASGVKEILRYGVAFSGKDVAVLSSYE